MFRVPEHYRLRAGPLQSTEHDGNNGMFLIPSSRTTRAMSVIARNWGEWEHVSVKAWDGRKACLPTWTEMCLIKNLFWDSEDCVMQLHLPASQDVNHPKTVLHLWRPVGQEIPQPPSLLVRMQSLGTISLDEVRVWSKDQARHGFPMLWE